MHEFPPSANESVERSWVYERRYASLISEKEVSTDHIPPPDSKAKKDQFSFSVFRFKDNRKTATKTSRDYVMSAICLPTRVSFYRCHS
jgi:hypothetical protein